MICDKCNKECETYEHVEVFTDDAYGSLGVFQTVFEFSTCCNEEVRSETND